MQPEILKQHLETIFRRGSKHKHGVVAFNEVITVDARNFVHVDYIPEILHALKELMQWRDNARFFSYVLNYHYFSISLTSEELTTPRPCINGFVVNNEIVEFEYYNGESQIIWTHPNTELVETVKLLSNYETELSTEFEQNYKYVLTSNIYRHMDHVSTNDWVYEVRRQLDLLPDTDAYYKSLLGILKRNIEIYKQFEIIKRNMIPFAISLRDPETIMGVFLKIEEYSS